MRFVLPLSPEMRFEGTTPTSKLLGIFMPWLNGRRPDWLIRFGLFLYDSIGGRKILPATTTLDLGTDPAGQALKPGFHKAYEYSDAWVQDARLVALNARDAAQRGAAILTGTKVVEAHREDGLWRIVTENTSDQATHYARALVNAAGPWVGEVLRGAIHVPSKEGVRLVRGSHIVTRKLYDHDRCYFLQGKDGRIIFAIPYEADFTLIGTTDQDHMGPPGEANITEAERDYLIGFANQYFREPIGVSDIVWTYSGVRPLYDDGASSATAATREYVLTLDTEGAPLLNVFGGKITTYRRLAEAALHKLSAPLGVTKSNWTAGVPLPGGDFPLAEKPNLIKALQAAHPFLTAPWATRLIRAYGTDAALILGEATSPEALGRDFGATLSEAEVRWLMDKEWARRAADVVWRRTKLGLRMTPDQIEVLDIWMLDQTRA
jgi:glycerol-3-phosphate dehydrogenase